jgi:hypothetical protein
MDRRRSTSMMPGFLACPLSKSDAHTLEPSGQAKQVFGRVLQPQVLRQHDFVLGGTSSPGPVWTSRHLLARVLGLEVLLLHPPGDDGPLGVGAIRSDGGRVE